MHTVVRCHAREHDAAGADAGPVASASPAPPATPARSCCACSRGIRRRVDRGDVVGRPAARRGRCRRSRASGTAPVTPLVARRARRDADVVFLALPDAAAAELAPRLVDAGVRVIDLSGAFRLRDAAARAPLVSARRTALPDGVATASPSASATRSRGARLVANPGCYPTAALLALAPLVDAGLLLPAPTSSSTPSRACRAPARRRPSGRTSPKCTAACRPTACSATATAPKSSRGSGATVTFAPHLVPLDRGILATIYVRVRAGHDRRALGDASTSAPTAARRSCGSSARRCRKSSTSRTRTSATSAGASTPSGRAILVSVIDNLLKGAAGQAVQNLNVCSASTSGRGCC